MNDHNSRFDYDVDLLLTSPMPGPPNTLISSLDEPPLSLIGMIYDSLACLSSARVLKTSVMLFAADPPEKTTMPF
jgi:hypothetical protein